MPSPTAPGRGKFTFPSRIYPILDVEACRGRDVLTMAAALLEGGAPLLQLRAKKVPTGAFVEMARALRQITASAGARLLINDRVDVALMVGADGVHLGQEDLSPAEARKILGPECLVGFSTHDPDQVAAAVRAGGADYLGFGPVFPTTNKERPDPVVGLEGLRRVRARSPVPLVAIGGIHADRMPAVLEAGADAVAMIGAVLDVEDVAANLSRLRQRADAVA